MGQSASSRVRWVMNATDVTAQACCTGDPENKPRAANEGLHKMGCLVRM